jgi:ribosome biogenesis GTPase A
MVRVRYSFSSRHTRHIKNIKKQRGKYPVLIREIIKMSDIILEVLDARFINETRNKEIEEEIKKENKKIIYVLNKSDLIDQKELEKKIKIRPYAFISCTERKGSFLLRNLIKRIVKETELPDEKRRAQIGVIGYPNTGKSSLINLLTGKSSARIGDQPGFTKGIQKVSLTKNILILDSPGVIPNNEYSSTNKEKVSKHAKVGSRSYSNVKNPDMIIQDLLNEPSIRKKIEKFYNIDSKGDSDYLLEELAKKKSFLKKAGNLDIDRTARDLLKDWQTGKIK